MKSFKHFLALLILISFNNNNHLLATNFLRKVFDVVTFKSSRQNVVTAVNQNQFLNKNGLQVQDNNLIPKVVNLKNQQQKANIITNNPKTAGAVGIGTLGIGYFVVNWFNKINKKKNPSIPETEKEKKTREMEEKLLSKQTPEEKIAFIQKNMQDINDVCKKIKDLNPTSITFEQQKGTFNYFLKFKDYFIYYSFAVDPELYVQIPSDERFYLKTPELTEDLLPPKEAPAK